MRTDLGERTVIRTTASPFPALKQSAILGWLPYAQYGFTRHRSTSECGAHMWKNIPRLVIKCLLPLQYACILDRNFICFNWSIEILSTIECIGFPNYFFFCMSDFFWSYCFSFISVIMQVPDNVKRNVRAVLLSKVGGVLVSDLVKDYKSLLKEPLRFKDLGFSSIKEFVDAMPDVCRWVGI